jgi:hypothetical protein
MDSRIMDIFQRIRQRTQERAEKLAERIRKPIETKIRFIEEQREYKARMKMIAEECQYFIQDRRYPYFQEYLDECIKTGEKSLRDICNYSKFKDEQVLQSARISAQLEVLNLLKNRALKIIQEYEKFRVKGGEK